jgi:starch-binding outer membrane protein, SusD/RagB family
MRRLFDDIFFGFKSSMLALSLTGLAIFHISCKKLVTVGSPNTSLTSGNIYTDDATAASVLTGLYALLNTNTPLAGGTVNSLSLVAGLSADELTLYGGSTNANTLLEQYYSNHLLAGIGNQSNGGIWNDCYSKLYTVNIALERLAVSTSLTPGVKQQLMGEAKFLRAFLYFYLVNLYGNTPLTITSDYTINASLARSSQTQVYQQIIADLKDAENLLTTGYVGSDALSQTIERIRPNKWAATALLARVYLYTAAYDSAETQASAVINNTGLYRSCGLDSIFLKNSSEAIWQLQPVNIGWNTEDARFFILPGTGPTINFPGSGFPVYISQQLLESFEPGDGRRIHWIDSVTVNGVTYYYPFKYKNATINAPVTEYLMVLRLGEQYLIRAEARARKNSNLPGARDDLNAIRNRANGPLPVTTTDQNLLLALIEHERQVELFTEWGNRWFDLKRTATIDVVMDSVAPAKASSWNSNWQWYPIPSNDILQDPKLVQNTGY